MPANTEIDDLERFNTRQRPIHDQQGSHQTDLHAISVRDRSQLALNESYARDTRALEDE